MSGPGGVFVNGARVLVEEEDTSGNTATGLRAFVGGGTYNTATGAYAVVGGGFAHAASGQ